MIKGKLTFEIEETRRFLDFLERTGRKNEIEHIEKYNQRTNECIHTLWDFIATATLDHNKKIDHLKDLNKEYKIYREHALNCKSCQISLDSIFTFTGYENKSIFSGIDTQKVLDAEWNSLSKNDLHLCKILPPGYTRLTQLTYITPLSLDKAYKQFEETIQKPLGLVNAFEMYYVRKVSNNGNGLSYFQLNLIPADKRHKTNFAIRSRLK